MTCWHKSYGTKHVFPYKFDAWLNVQNCHATKHLGTPAAGCVTTSSSKVKNYSPFYAYRNPGFEATNRESHENTKGNTASPVLPFYLQGHVSWDTATTQLLPVAETH
jgi:hypothetical protein